jgi:hypothetical protein
MATFYIDSPNISYFLLMKKNENSPDPALPHFGKLPPVFHPLTEDVNWGMLKTSDRKVLVRGKGTELSLVLMVEEEFTHPDEEVIIELHTLKLKNLLVLFYPGPLKDHIEDEYAIRRFVLRIQDCEVNNFLGARVVTTGLLRITDDSIQPLAVWNKNAYYMLPKAKPLEGVLNVFNSQITTPYTIRELGYMMSRFPEVVIRNSVYKLDLSWAKFDNVPSIPGVEE